MILSNKKSVESVEITNDIIADYDETGNLVGIEILSAKAKVDFHDLLVDSLPFTNVNIINNTVVV